MKQTESDKRPRLLFVAYDFPPMVSAGIYRTAAITRYLRKHGWNVTVLTVRHDGTGDRRQSEGLVEDDTEVIRTRSFEYHRVRDRMKDRVRGNPLESTEGRAPQPSSRQRVMHAIKLPLRIVDRALTFPDWRVGWFFPLLFRGARLLARRRYRIVMSSSPPHSSHLPLLVLRWVFDFRWVVDFRDPWNAPPRSINRRVAPRLHRWLEARVLSRCDVVIANTPGNKRELEREFGAIVDGKVVLMTNGFDPEFYAKRASLPDRRVDLDCDLVYTGHLYSPMFFKYRSALRAIRQSGGGIPKLHIFGPPFEPRVAAQIKADGLESHIVHQGALTHAETMAVAQRARALLLLLPHGPLFKYWVPSKLYTYLNSNTPVLALVNSGDAADIVQKTGTGVVVTSAEPNVIAEAILSFVASSQTNNIDLAINRSAVREYSWETLGGRLDELLRAQLTNGADPSLESVRGQAGSATPGGAE